MQGGVFVRLRSLLGRLLDNLELLDKIPEYAVGMTVFVVSLAVIHAAGRFAFEPLAERALRVRDVNLTVRGAILRVVRAGIWFAGILLALDLAGIDVFGASATLAAALTIAVGFATRDIASNFVSGVFIVTDPRFNIGDWIRWTENEGVIEDITFRVTRVRTFDNELITVPNSVLATNAVTNSVAGDALRVTHVFPVGYGADVDAVSAILLEEAERNDAVSDDPEPSVRIVDMNDSRIDVEVRFWIDDPNHSEFVAARSEFFRRVERRLDEAGISLSG
ncbi:mechanosensitive ion channel family protein [Haladaptatus salinisoli]|uniref:mechanosensitive ion channel family protein n=1 Tax=Haladaptatus salinisoli TaxID=2884876 RepID=UPI001D0A8ACE|nr:mechanosensitive ion channel family protein [Haladaptatus salinisoli]